MDVLLWVEKFAFTCGIEVADQEFRINLFRGVYCIIPKSIYG